MPLGELILSGDVLNVGRVKLNKVYSAQTAIWSAGTGTFGLYNVVRGNYLGTNFGNSAASYHTIAAGVANTVNNTSPYSMCFWGSGNTVTGSQFATLVNGRINKIYSSNYGIIIGGVSNTVTGSASAIVGGNSNAILGPFSNIAGGRRNSANTLSFAASIGGGAYNQVNGQYATIFGGHNNRATANGSVAGGWYNKAYGVKSIAIGGNGNISNNLGSAIFGGNGNTNNGGYAFIGGGQGNIAGSSFAAAVGGLTNNASGTRSFIGGGNNNTTSGTRSAIIGGQTNTVSNSYSGIFAGRNNNVTSVHSAILGGFYNTVSAPQSAIIAGRGNLVQHGNSVAMGGGAQTKPGLSYQFVIGGVGTITPNVVNNRFRVNASTGGYNPNGSCYANGNFFFGGADFGEFFEWNDGNPNNEDRRAYAVSLIDGKIEIGNLNIVGIISSNASAVGDSADFYWSGMYLKDDFGKTLTEEYKRYEWIENVSESGGTNEIIKVIFENSVGDKFIEHPNASHKNGVPFTGQTPINTTTSTIKVQKLNPDYNSENEYIPRTERKEWSIVGLLGKLHIRTAEQITSNLIDVNSDGMAVNGTTYKVLEKIRPHTENKYGIVRVFFK